MGADQGLPGCGGGRALSDCSVMYRIRVTTEDVLEVALSGNVPLPEAMRAVTQAAALMEAGGIRRCTCDLRDVSGAPGGGGAIAAAVGARLPTGARVAFVVSRRQRGYTAALVRRAGLEGSTGMFDSPAKGLAWLNGRAGAGISARKRRHYAAIAAAAETDSANASGAQRDVA